MKLPNFYAAVPLDRVSHRRKEIEWVAAGARHAETRFVAVWRMRSLVHDIGSGPAPLYLRWPQIESLVEAGAQTALLGLPGQDGEGACFALNLNHLDKPLAALNIAEGEASFRDLREVGPVLDRGDAATLAYARGLIHWHERHGFCGVCGAPTRSIEAGHVRECTGESCGTHHFPRTDPAVIMLVHDGDRCLLGRQPGWPKGVYSTLAGFVEPGESLEEAVAREVFEESGIRVSDVVYQSSQPWPFPASIMLGFWAQAASTEIDIGTLELEHARWVTRDQLRHCRDNGILLPPGVSISGRLIEDWVALDGLGALSPDSYTLSMRPRNEAAG